MSPRDLVDYAERVVKLDVIAVTDHDELAGALEARDWADRQGYRVKVIAGVEVTTRDGHLLALWMEDRPPALRSALATAAWVRDRGGLCVAPHPFTRLTHALNARTMRLLAEEGLLAGVEVLNASPAGRTSRTGASRFAGARQLAPLGGSDAHVLGCVGLAFTRFTGHSPEDLRRAIETATTQPEGRFANASEIAAEALPQLARSLVHLPLRRIRARLVPALRGLVPKGS